MEKFRHIFERFQNLNLIVLLEDLRRGLVCQGAWYGHRVWYEYSSNLVWGLGRRRVVMCPLAHGLPTCLEGQTRFATHDSSFVGEILGCGGDEVRNFISHWDGYPKNDQLGKMLESILKERKDDAEAVQAVIAERETVTA